MPRVCTVCTHDERHAINVALVHREPYRRIAARFDVSTTALQRHSQDHLPQLLVEASRSLEQHEGLDVVKQLKAANSVVWEVLQDARTSGEPETVLRAVDRVQKQIELQARLLGDLDERPVVNLNLSPEWLELRTVIVGALGAHPDARGAVLRAIEAAGDGRA